MKLTLSLLLIACTASAQIPIVDNSNLLINFREAEEIALAHDNHHFLRTRRHLSHKSEKNQKCKDPEEDLDLSVFPQWADETGYWIGEYTLLGGDGNASISPTWNYPYDHYMGFITGNVNGNSYRQRNVFLYPPQKNTTSTSCPSATGGDVGEGECGVNGNTKVFFADQSATECTDTGSISGPYQDVFNTYTTLVGNSNAVLYQVYLKGVMLGLTDDILYQSQLTTITKASDGSTRRTRTAQLFQAFDPSTMGTSTGTSYYRERKVGKEEFYATLESKLAEYNILESDTCAWQNNAMGQNEATVYTPGVEGCKAHLEQSFALEF